jgi:UTP-glucose-1-phosphate uridylyltransferase
MKTLINVCVIPAAGEGTRWSPFSNFVPKEMVPFGRRPVIEWSIKEATESGCQKIVVVINKKKEIIKNYLLEQQKHYPHTQFFFVYQNKPLGIINAILKAEIYMEKQPFAVLFPDTPSTYKVPPLKQMFEVYKKADIESYVLPFAEYPKHNLLSYGECLLKKRKGGLLNVVHVCPRPKIIGKSHHPGNNLHLAGREIFPKNSLALFKALYREHGKKADDGDVLNLALSLNKQVLGVKIKGMIYEVGNYDSYTQSYSRLSKEDNTLRYW